MLDTRDRPQNEESDEEERHCSRGYVTKPFLELGLRDALSALFRPGVISYPGG
jgi:hypothetical protein